MFTFAKKRMFLVIAFDKKAMETVELGLFWSLSCSQCSVFNENTITLCVKVIYNLVAENT